MNIIDAIKSEDDYGLAEGIKSICAKLRPELQRSAVNYVYCYLRVKKTNGSWERLTWEKLKGLLSKWPDEAHARAYIRTIITRNWGEIRDGVKEEDQHFKKKKGGKKWKKKKGGKKRKTEEIKDGVEKHQRVIHTPNPDQYPSQYPSPDEIMFRDEKEYNKFDDFIKSIFTKLQSEAGNLTSTYQRMFEGLQRSDLVKIYQNNVYNYVILLLTERLRPPVISRQHSRSKYSRSTSIIDIEVSQDLKEQLEGVSIANINGIIAKISSMKSKIGPLTERDFNELKKMQEDGYNAFRRNDSALWNNIELKQKNSNAVNQFKEEMENFLSRYIDYEYEGIGMRHISIGALVDAFYTTFYRSRFPNDKVRALACRYIMIMNNDPMCSHFRAESYRKSIIYKMLKEYPAYTDYFL